MISFAMIGAGNALVDFAVFAFAYKLLELPIVPSNVLAWLVAVSGSYVMNTLITFRHESGRNSQARGLSKIRRFRNSGRLCGDHNARRPFVFC